MKKNLTFGWIAGLALLPALLANNAIANHSADRGQIVVCNRASGDLSVIDVATDAVRTVAMPAGANPSDPMYANYSALYDRFFVGDRANNRVVVFDGSSFAVEGTIAAGNGVFHQWVGTYGEQLWVNNDIDKTTTVIDAVTLKSLAVIATPADLVAQGGKPHDVFVDPSGRHAFITVLGLTGSNDYVVQFSTRTFRETARAEVGKDPHLVTSRRTRNLFVAAQGSSEVYVLDRRSLAQRDVLSVPAAHGITIDGSGRTVYVTNISGGGTDAITSIRLRGRNARVFGTPPSTPAGGPHNVWLSGDGGTLYATHSGGTSTLVTIFDIPRAGAAPVFVKTVTVGTNPFGLTFVP